MTTSYDERTRRAFQVWQQAVEKARQLKVLQTFATIIEGRANYSMLQHYASNVSQPR